MLIRLDTRRRFRTSPLTARVPCNRRNATGITIWLDTMVDTAIAATITMEVAEENPPKKANSASSCRS